LGHHEFVYGLAGHAGDWRQGETDWQAQRLNQPLIAFESSSHSGALGKSLSLLKVNNSRVRVLAFKKAEESDDVIVRFVEMSGKDEPDVHISFAAPVLSAREVNGQEMPVAGSSPKVAGGELVTSLTAYQVRSFAVKIGPAKTRVAAPVSRPVSLTYDISVASHDGRPAEGAFDWLPNGPSQSQGKALPAEMLPADIAYGGVHFKLAPAGTGKPDAVTPTGQTIALPGGKFTRVYILAASYSGGRGGGQESPNPDVKATFKVGDKPVDLSIENWTGYIGQWDNRNWEMKDVQVPINRPANAPPLPAGAPATRTVRQMEFTGVLTPGFIKRADVAWFASHRHDSAGLNEAYAYSYLFAYAIDVPEGAKTLTLPDNERIRILAISVANEPAPVWPARPLYDKLERVDR
jgi:alpha-mannosidase